MLQIDNIVVNELKNNKSLLQEFLTINRTQNDYQAFQTFEAMIEKTKEKRLRNAKVRTDRQVLEDKLRRIEEAAENKRKEEERKRVFE